MSKTYREFRLDTINVKIDEEIYKYYNVLDGDSSRHVCIATRKPFTRDYKYVTVNGLKILFWDFIQECKRFKRSKYKETSGRCNSI